MSEKKYQLCPKCQGQGTVSKPPHVPGDIHEWICATSISYVCDLCHGAKIIATPFDLALDESGTAAAINQDAHEKEIMMQAFDKVRQIFEGRQWIMEGRGSYPYNDDRYKEEVRYMYDEFDQVFKDTWNNIKSKSIEYRELIIDEYLKKDHPATHDVLTRLGYQKIEKPILTQSRADFIREVNERDMDGLEAIEFAEWFWGYCKEYRRGGTYVTNFNEVMTVKELYELFKQQKENP